MDEWDGIRGQDVVHKRVGEVVSPALDRTLPLDVVLEPEANEGEHGEPAVLDLLELELLQVLGGPRGPSEQVEDSPRVSRLVVAGQLVLLEDGVLVHAPLLLHVLVPSDLDPVHQEKLDDEVDLGVVIVLEGRGVHEVDAGARPLHAELGRGLGRQDPEAPQHGEAGVQELRLREPLELLRLRPELERIEPVVTREAPVQVLWLRRSRVPRRQGLSGLGHHPATLDQRRRRRGSLPQRSGVHLRHR
mmetsp:Transcript_11145/g.31115  ORF Transcript_11145/g.31115 Transcript_11145/m.31115 type:complete len:246 (-) Transcript_11145:146-883(-)